MKPRSVIIGVVLAVFLPLWIGFAWTTGLIRIGAEPEITGQIPAFEQMTVRDPDALSFCFGKDYTGLLPLNRANSPPQPPQTTRFRNRLLHLVVDISAQSSNGSVVRVFKLNDTPLSPVHQRAIQSCIPENGLPVAGDPRSHEFYSSGE